MATLGIFIIFFVINVIFVNKETIEKSVENEKLKKETSELSTKLENKKIADLKKIKEKKEQNDKKLKEIEAGISTVSTSLSSMNQNINSLTLMIKNEFNISGKLDFAKINKEIRFRSKKLTKELQDAKVKRGKLGSEYSEYIEAQGETPSLKVYPTSYFIEISSRKHGSRKFTETEFLHILDAINRGSGFNIVVDFDKIKRYSNSNEENFSLHPTIKKLNNILRRGEWVGAIEEEVSTNSTSTVKDNSSKIINELAQFERMIKKNQSSKKNDILSKSQEKKSKKTVISSNDKKSKSTLFKDPSKSSEKGKKSQEKLSPKNQEKAKKIDKKSENEKKTYTNKDYKFTPYEKPPRPLRPIKPIYPRSAINQKIEGDVIVQCFINKNGIVEDAVVIQGYPNTGLNESALEAVKKTKFSPARQNNNRVGVWYTIPIKYTLNQ